MMLIRAFLVLVIGSVICALEASRADLGSTLVDLLYMLVLHGAVLWNFLAVWAYRRFLHGQLAGVAARRGQVAAQNCWPG